MIHIIETGQDSPVSAVSSSSHGLCFWVAMCPRWLGMCLKHQNCLVLSSQSYCKPSLVVTPSTEADRKKRKTNWLGLFLELPAHTLSLGGYPTTESDIIRKSICRLERSQEVGWPMEAAVLRNQSFFKGSMNSTKYHPIITYNCTNLFRVLKLVSF